MCGCKVRRIGGSKALDIYSTHQSKVYLFKSLFFQTLGIIFRFYSLRTCKGEDWRHKQSERGCGTLMRLVKWAMQ